MCDATDYAVGAMLGQRKGRIFNVIYYASKVLNDAQVNYATTEKEMLAIVYALEKFRSWWDQKSSFTLIMQQLNICSTRLILNLD